MPTPPTDSARAQVMAVLDERVAAIEAKDIDRLMAIFADNIVYFDIIPPRQFVGADALRTNFLRWFDEYQGGIGLEMHDLDVAVGDRVAFAHMVHADSGVRRNGEDVTVWVRSTVCLQHVDGRWLITHEHISFPMDVENWNAVVGTP